MSFSISMVSVLIGLHAGIKHTHIHTHTTNKNSIFVEEALSTTGRSSLNFGRLKSIKNFIITLSTFICYHFQAHNISKRHIPSKNNTHTFKKVNFCTISSLPGYSLGPRSTSSRINLTFQAHTGVG